MIQIAYTDTIGERKVIEKEVAINSLLNTGSEMPSGKTGRIQQNALKPTNGILSGPSS